MQPSPIAKAYEAYRTSIVPDAGAAHLPHQPHGNPGEVYPCPSHSGASCALCGGSGYRAVCNLTACHEYGCQDGTCGRPASDYLAPRNP